MQRPTRRSRMLVAAFATLGLAAVVAAFTTIGSASPAAIPAAIQYAPQNTATPTVSGDTRVGSTLTTTNGSWTSSAGNVTYTYQWQRCNSAGANCASIGAATKQTYVVATADVGSRLRSVVTARNNDGSSVSNVGSYRRHRGGRACRTSPPIEWADLDPGIFSDAAGAACRQRHPVRAEPDQVAKSVPSTIPGARHSGVRRPQRDRIRECNPIRSDRAAA